MHYGIRHDSHLRSLIILLTLKLLCQRISLCLVKNLLPKIEINPDREGWCVYKSQLRSVNSNFSFHYVVKLPTSLNVFAYFIKKIKKLICFLYTYEDKKYGYFCTQSARQVNIHVLFRRYCRKKLNIYISNFNCFKLETHRRKLVGIFFKVTPNMYEYILRTSTKLLQALK